MKKKNRASNTNQEVLYNMMNTMLYLILCWMCCKRKLDTLVSLPLNAFSNVKKGL